MLEFAALIIGVLATVTLAFIVYLKDRRAVTNRLFMVLAACLVGWSIATYLSLHTSSNEQTLYWIRWIMLAVVCQNTVLFLLAHVFPGTSAPQLKKTRYKIAVAYSVIVALATISPWLFTSFKDGAPQPGPAMPLFLVHVIIFALGSVITLARRYHQAHGQERAQLGYLLVGMLLLVTIEPACNFMLPVAFGSNLLVTYSPIYSIVFSGLIAYAIVRHKLFDIRAFVLRAVVYVFSTVLLSIVFIVPLVLGVVAITQVHFTWGRLIWGVLGATVFALFYNRVRIAFDNLTNRVFFRGYYEPQDVINQLSEALVYSVNAEQIERHSKRILNKAIKAGKFDFWLMDTVGSGVDQPAELHSLGELFHGRTGSNVCITAEQPAGSKLAAFLREQDTAALIRLRAGSATLGFMALGFKESGGTFSLRDRQLLNIASNEIAIALQDALHFEEIQNFNRTLQERVQKATRELKHSNEKLRALDETKDEFITMASHQLRTPLTSVKGYLSMVLEGDTGKLNAQQAKMLRQSFVSAQRMVYLIADLLNLSRLNTGKFVIESTPTDLVEVVQSEVDQLVETARAREVKLVFRPPANFPILLLDENKVHQVVMNFIDNAIYYTPAGGTIDVELKDDGANVEYLVHDTGIGVPRPEQHRLFTKFYRAANARRARPDGTGLGLFMAKKVVVAQGGVIIFESEEGKGSTFGFRFSKRRHMVPVNPGSEDASVESASTIATTIAK